MQNDVPIPRIYKSLSKLDQNIICVGIVQCGTFSGISSAIIKNGRGKIPHEATKKQNENEATGIQDQPSKSKPSVCKYMYEPRHDKPIAVPADEIVKRICEELDR